MKSVPILCWSALGLALLAVSSTTCSGTQLADVFEADCGSYQTDYATALQQGGRLRDSIPDTASGYAMALVLNQAAVNDLFARLADVGLPELEESTTVLGQRLAVSVRPELPLLQVGGQGACPDCFQARVPFDVGASLAGIELPRGAGAISAQMPIRLLPIAGERTALVAQFQSLEVLGLELNFRNEVARNIFEAVEPLISRALTVFLQSRFEDATIVTMDTWRLGGGQVKLAGRGPFVDRDNQTVLIALQSNLAVTQAHALSAEPQLPAGADLGIIVHPGLLGAMARRMIFEDVIPQSYNGQGEPADAGDVHLTLSAVGASDDGLLRARSTLWKTGSFCGAADVAASIALSASPDGVSFAIRDVEVSNGRGSGQLLQQADRMVGGYLDALLETLEVTVNYDEIYGGQRAEQPRVETFQLNVDGRGVSLFLDLL